MTRYTGFQDTLFFNAGELTAPGITNEVATYENNYFSTKDYTLIATVTNINKEVVVRLEGSIDGTNYGPLISNCITKDGTYVYNITSSPVKFVRGRFFSEVDYNITGTAFTQGTGRVLASGYTIGANQGSTPVDILKEALFTFQLERNSFTATPFELTLVAASDVAGADIYASMDWEEISR